MTITDKQLKIGVGVLHAKICGRVQLNKHVGKFTSAKLQDYADAGEWQTLVSGVGLAIPGFGSTPLLAIKDAISRNLERAVTHLRVCQDLAAVCGEFAAAEGLATPDSVELQLEQLERVLNTLYAHRPTQLPEGTVAKRLRAFVEQLEQRAAARNPGGET